MSNPERPDPLALIAKMAAEEQKLSDQLFLAPVVAGGQVRVRVAGIVYALRLDDPSFEGWALLQTQSKKPGHASVVGKPTIAKISEYLKMLPRLRVVLLDQFENRWWGIQASAGDKNFQTTGALPVTLVSSAASLDTVYVRFDGAHFWYETIDRRRDPTVARTLRQALHNDTHPQELHCKGMVPEERVAYTMLYLKKHPAANAIRREKNSAELIEEALGHAGARLDAFWLHNENQATVRFEHNGRTHTASVNPKNLTLFSAGVCLSGQDQNFDLASLVGILEEHERKGGIYDYEHD